MYRSKWNLQDIEVKFTKYRIWFWNKIPYVWNMAYSDTPPHPYPLPYTSEVFAMSEIEITQCAHMQQNFTVLVYDIVYRKVIVSSEYHKCKNEVLASREWINSSSHILQKERIFELFTVLMASLIHVASSCEECICW